MRRRKAMSKYERKMQIVLFFQLQTEKDNRFVATVARIARALDMTPSQHLRRICDETLDDGLLAAFDVPRKGVCKYTRYYMLHPRRGKPRKGRAIPIRRNGEVVDTLEIAEEFESNA